MAEFLMFKGNLNELKGKIDYKTINVGNLTMYPLSIQINQTRKKEEFKDLNKIFRKDRYDRFQAMDEGGKVYIFHLCIATL